MERKVPNTSETQTHDFRSRVEVYNHSGALGSSLPSSLSHFSASLSPNTFVYDVDDCYSSSDHGQSYTGQLATTQRGEHCQSWNEPHLLFHPGFYPELDGAANLCRNPGQLKDRIWCFMSESAWDYCPIPTNCSKYLSYRF